MLALRTGLAGHSGSAFGASGSKKTAVVTAAAAQNPADYVGSEVCATCHADVAKKFEANPHTKMALMHGKTRHYLRELPRRGKAHVDGGRRRHEDIQIR